MHVTVCWRHHEARQKEAASETAVLTYSACRVPVIRIRQALLASERTQMTDYSYVPKTDYYPFQKVRFEAHSLKKVWAHFDDQGTGKAKDGADTAAQWFELGWVDAMLVAAPGEVANNWERKELPKHLPDRIKRNVFLFDPKKAKQKAHLAAMERALSYRDGLSIVLITYSAFTTVAGKAFVKKFLKKRRVAYMLDESQNIRTPKAIRTKSIVASGDYAELKRIYSGTPIGKTGPLGLYSQIKFLDNEFWKRKGINSYELFKSFFADWFQTDQGYKILKGYKNEHIMQEWLKEISSRVVKSEVLPDLPPKLHSRLYFDLPSEHRRVYEQMANNLRAELLSGVEVEVELAITKLRKLMQICCGYIKEADTMDPAGGMVRGRTHPINDELPRVDMTVAWAEGITGQTIIWCRQIHDVDLICKALGSAASRFDGHFKGIARTAQLESWERGDTQHLVSNAKVGGTGLTLNQAHDVLFNAVDVDSVEFKQAQDRCHRPGQHNPVNYTYLIAKDTCDEKIVDSLIANEDVVQRIFGGKLMELL